MNCFKKNLKMVKGKHLVPYKVAASKYIKGIEL